MEADADNPSIPRVTWLLKDRVSHEWSIRVRAARDSNPSRQIRSLGRLET
jgi:hypothetical protein